MKINKNFTKMSKYNPTKRTYQMSVLNICEKIELNQITLPLFQRDVSWTLSKSVALLNYQLLGKAPVAPISVNEIKDVNSCVSQISFITREIIEAKYGQLSTNDGQQRLTTNLKAYLNHEQFKNVVLDIAKGKFIIIEEEIKRTQIPVGILLNKDNEVFHKYFETNTLLKKPECMSLLFEVRNKLRDYNYTINLAEDLTEEEQIEWFEVLNNAGSRVTRIQMRFSKLKMNNIDIYSEYTNKYKMKLEEAGMDLFKVKNTEVSIPVSVLNTAYEVVTGKSHTSNYSPFASDTNENRLCDLKAEELKICFRITLKGLDRAIDFVYANNLKIPTRIDYMTYLTGLFVFLGDKELTIEQTDKIIGWYEETKFENKSNTKRRALFSKLISFIGIETAK